ncbi:MAG TPA: Ig-like domain-containing protein [Clostridia bacterium]|nr:Ig-like domain-containing protein [Clostridia bacterium]
MKEKLFSFFSKKPVLIVSAVIIVFAAAAVIAAALGLFGGNGDGAPDISAMTDTTALSGDLSFMDSDIKINAEDSDSIGVNPTSAFRLLFDKAPGEKALAASLSVEPEQSYSLKKVSEKEYSVEFEKPMTANSIYSFVLNDKNTGKKHSWSFQTKRAFSVVSTLPRDKSSQVPANSGIEITFSHKDAENAEKNFSISPEVKGRFEWHDRTMVFVPEKLEDGTIYTVTLKKGTGIKGSSETLSEDLTFRFQTEMPGSNSGNLYYSFSDIVYSFSPKETPALSIYADEKLKDADVAVDLYAYSGHEAFLNDLKQLTAAPYWAMSGNSFSYDTGKLQKAASVTAHIYTQNTNYWNNTYLVLPSTLPEGYYLVSAEVDGAKYYTQLQINGSSVYIMMTKKQSIAWLNDQATGQPLEGAEFMLDGGKAVKSDNNGMAVLDEPMRDTEANCTFFLVRPVTGPVYVARVLNNVYQPYYDYNFRNSSDVRDDYWTYLYLDKDMFLPDDTINIWGVLKPRDGSGAENEATLELMRYVYYSEENEASVLSSQKVKISPNGTFSGNLKISGFNPGSYEVRVLVGDKVLVSRYAEVMDYTKPVYKLEINSDRKYISLGDKINYSILSSFYEGTPVSGMKLSYTGDIYGSTQLEGELVSDNSGASKLTLQPFTQEQSWRPLSFGLTVRNKESGEQQVMESNYVLLFARDTMVAVDTETKENKCTFSFETNRIDLSRLETEGINIYDEKNYKGASVDMPLTGELYERHYESKKTGSYYDFINKVTQDIYEYYEVQNLVQKYSFQTVNGKYSFDFELDKNKQYILEVFGNDSQGRPIHETAYAYGWDWHYYDGYGNSTYSIAGNAYDHTFKQDETVSVEVKYNDEQPFTGSNRRYLFVRLQNGILDYKVSADPVYNFGFDKKLIPNMYVKAVCFDGTNVNDAGIRQYWYDSSEKSLDISVKPDKDYYRPGDTVKLAFEVKDAKGVPCSAELNVSVVDEAFFTLSPQYVDTLSSLYSPSISSGLVSDYFSYTPVDKSGSPMAEMGEGGDEYVRKDFRDSAFFRSVITDSSGKAEATFKMPDNLTSWRITYQAVTDDLKAGNGKSNISTKLPFFADTVFNKNFITGDNPSIQLNAYGTELPENGKIDYELTLVDTNGAKKTYKTEGTAHQPTLLPMGKLDAGDYTLTIKASCGNLQDALERKFKVSGSLLETCQTNYKLLMDDTVLSNGVKGLTSLVFYGEDSTLLYRELQSLYWNWGHRLDQKLAEKVGAKLLTNYFGEVTYSDEAFDISQYQLDDGGLALLTYGSSNPALSAKFSSLAADGIDREALAAYFYKLLANQDTVPEDAAYAYWGLAALKEPVLLDIRTLLSSDGLTPEIKLILGNALAEIGDFQGARDIYAEAMKRSTITDTMAWLTNETRDKGVDQTSLCSLIALRINAPEKLKLFNYISLNSTSELLVNLERMIFATSYIKEASLDNSFNYELDGAVKQVELKNGGCYRLVVTPEKLGNIKFSNVKGKIQVAASYVAPVSEIRGTEGNPVSLERAYTAVNGAGSGDTFKKSDTIKVTITPGFGSAAPDGYYEITDVLPAGFRYVRSDFVEEADGHTWYPDEVTGQKVVFGYYYDKNGYKRGSITYYAVAVTPGEFTADNAAISHTDSKVIGFTEREQIRITK